MAVHHVEVESEGVEATGHFVSLDALGPGFVVILDDATRGADTDAERAYARPAHGRRVTGGQPTSGPFLKVARSAATRLLPPCWPSKLAVPSAPHSALITD